MRTWLLVAGAVALLALVAWAVRRPRRIMHVGRRGLSPLQRALLWVSGGNPDHAVEVPHEELVGLTARAVMLLASVVLSFSSFRYLSITVFSLDAYSGTWAALGWACFIWGLERSLLATFHVSVWAVVFRVVLSVVLVALISEPLLLRIFESDINLQVQLNQDRQMKIVDADLDSRYGPRIKAAEKVRGTAQADVKRAELMQSNAEDAMLQAQRLELCERGGVRRATLGCSGTSGKAGAGVETNLRARATRVARDRYEKARRRLTDVKTEARTQAGEAQRQLQGAKHDRAAERGPRLKKVTESDGLVARYAALNDVARNNGMEWLVWLVRIALFFVDLTPLGVKISTRMPGYEALASTAEHRVRREAQVARRATDLENEADEAIVEAAAERRLKTELARSADDSVGQGGDASVVDLPGVAPAEADRECIGRLATPPPHSDPKAWLEGAGIIVEERGKRLLSGVDVQLPVGAMTAVVGPSGAGKTTLLRVAAGDLRPSSGTLSFMGAVASSERLRSVVRYVPQGEEGLEPELTVRETLGLAAEIRLPAISKCEREKRVADVSEWLQLTPRLHGRRVSVLSGGERRRLSVAIELVGESAAVVLDEPSSGLDVGLHRFLVEALRMACKQSGMSVLMSTHHLEGLEAMDAVLAINAKGQLAFAGSPAGLPQTQGHADWASYMDALRQ